MILGEPSPSERLAATVWRIADRARVLFENELRVHYLTPDQRYSLSEQASWIITEVFISRILGIWPYEAERTIFRSTMKLCTTSVGD